MKTLYVTIKVVIDDKIDPDVFIDEVDYSFHGYGIIETEISHYILKEENNDVAI